LDISGLLELFPLAVLKISLVFGQKEGDGTNWGPFAPLFPCTPSSSKVNRPIQIDDFQHGGGLIFVRQFGCFMGRPLRRLPLQDGKGSPSFDIE